MYAANRNAKKKLKRRDALIEKQIACIETQQQTIIGYKNKVFGSDSQVKKLHAKLDRVNHRALYWKKKVKDISSSESTKKKKLQDEVQSLKEEIASLSLENSEFDDVIQSIESEITTFEHGKYTDDVRACIYELLSLNVGVRNVGPIIRSVLKNIAHKSATRLPSYGLMCQMMLESLTVVQAQLGDCLSEASGFTTLQTDGTTKFGDHYATYDVQTDSFSFTLGLRHVFSGSSMDTLETLKQILDDIDSVQLALGHQAASSKIITKIKNTMSDRHAAEKLFNEILHDYREEILPSVFDNWEELTTAEKQQLTRMNNFFCGLHFLVGLAESADKTLTLWESSLLSDDISSPPSSSSTQKLIRAACKSFHHRGSQQCGTSTLFCSYLKQQGIFKLPLAQFVGNRFNILFYDGAGIYYLQNHMVKFIESVHGKNANRLLVSVLNDLKTPSLIAGCRALGLIDKIITGPLWRKLEESTTSVLKMGSTYCELKHKLDLWSTDSSSLLDGSARCIEGIPIHSDEVWDTLIQSSSTDEMTLELLQLLCKAFSVTTQRLLVDHLPNGIYYNVTDEELIKETASVPTTNVSPERDFAVLDRYLRNKPNAHLISLEAIILFAHNKTSSWMEKLPHDEREKLYKAARSLAPSFKEKFKARRQEIEARRKEDMEKRIEENARKELNKMKEKESLTKKMQENGGLWTKKEELENGLALFSTQKKKKEALKLQINF